MEPPATAIWRCRSTHSAMAIYLYIYQCEHFNNKIEPNEPAVKSSL